MKNCHSWFRACVNTLRFREQLALIEPLSVVDNKHQYKAPHANRPGDRPYKRKKKR